MKKLLILLIICSVGMVSKAQNTMNIYQNNGTVLQIPLSTIDSITYTLGNPGNVTSLTTLPIGNITASGASSGGNITSDGGSPVTQRGICWSTSQNPTTANTNTSNGSGVGSYVSSLTGLTANTTYYVRAYAINSAGTAYGNQVNFTANSSNGWLNPNLTYGSMIDQDGNTYATIVIGTQEWMAENLRTTTYANGDPIPHILDGSEWGTLTAGAWCHYEHNYQNETTYGKLYNRYTAVDSRNVCPSNWHVPTHAEWVILSYFLDPDSAIGTFGNLAGGQMKSVGDLQGVTGLWTAPNTGATNASGFTGHPSGYRLHNSGSAFYDISERGYWWHATEYTGNNNVGRAVVLINESAVLWRDTPAEKNGMSIRCLRD